MPCLFFRGSYTIFQESLRLFSKKPYFSIERKRIFQESLFSHRTDEKILQPFSTTAKLVTFFSDFRFISTDLYRDKIRCTKTHRGARGLVLANIKRAQGRSVYTEPVCYGVDWKSKNIKTSNFLDLYLLFLRITL